MAIIMRELANIKLFHLE